MITRVFNIRTERAHALQESWALRLLVRAHGRYPRVSPRQRWWDQ